MFFDPTLLIITIIIIVSFWSTIKLLRNKFNSVAEKALNAIDDSVTVAAIGHQENIQTELKQHLKNIEAGGGWLHIQDEYDKLFNKH